MSLSDATETAVLNMLLKGTDPAYRTTTPIYLALFLDNASTVADLEAGGYTYELNYSGANTYARIALPKANAWTVAGNTATNAAQLQFAKRTDGGATQSAKYFAVVDTASGAYTMGIWGTLTDAIAISIGVQPTFDIGVLSIVAD